MLNCIELFDELVQIPICGRVRVFVGVVTRAHVRAVCVRANARGCLVLMVVVVVARARE